MALLDLDSPEVTERLRPSKPAPEFPIEPTHPRKPTSALHDLVLAEDKTWHSWVEFGDHVHRCVCGDPERHHNRLVAISQGKGR